MLTKGTKLMVRVLLAAALMWLATRQVAWTDVYSAFRNGSTRWFGICLGLVVIDRALMAWRWVALLRVVETGPRVPLIQLVRLFFVSTLAGTVIPGNIAGDALRAVGASRLGASLPSSVGSVAVDRLLGTLSVLLMAVVGVVLAGRRLEAWWLWFALAIAAAGLAGTMLLLFDSRILAGLVRWAGGGRFTTIERWAHKFLLAIRQYGHHRGVLAGVLAASVAVQILRSAQTWCLGLAIGLTISGDWYFALIPFCTLAWLMPASVSGLGLGTASFVPLFALAGVPASDAVALSLLFWFLGILGNLPGAVLILIAPGSVPSLRQPNT
jgi:uncharacterized protein (TIRG00374 family)